MRTVRATVAILCVISSVDASAQDAFRSMQLQVLDAAGQPLNDATVEVVTADMDFPLLVNKDGFATLNLPTDAAHLMLKAYCANHIPLEVRWLRENIPADFTFKLSRGQPIGGIVIDERGQPIKGVVVEGLLVSSRVAPEGTVRPQVGGELGTTDGQGRWRAEVAPAEPVELRLKLSHDDYFSDLSFGKRRVSNDELRSLEHVEILADRISPQGTVTDADGNAVADVSLYVLDGLEPLVLENGKPTNEPPGQRVTTDPQGGYQFTEQEGDYAVVCLSDAGWAVVPSKRYEKNQPVEIRLTRWARVHGTLAVADKPCASEKLQLLVHDSELLGGNRYAVWNNFATTDDKGEFTFERLTDGYATLGQCVEYCGDSQRKRRDFSNEFQTTLRAGANVNLSCIRRGNVVRGTIVPLHYDGSEATLECGMIVLEKDDDALDFVKDIFFEMGKESTLGVQFDPTATRSMVSSRPKASYLGRVEADGSFRIEHVPPGDYRARITVWCAEYEDAELEKTEAGWHEGSIWDAFSVRPEDPGKSVDLGLLELEVYATEE